MKNVLKSIKITIAFCVLLSLGYVLVLWLVAGVVTPRGGRFETLSLNDSIVGGANIGQTFTKEIYFWGRPSAVDYDASGSGGSNKATTNPEYLKEIESRITIFLAAHPYLTRAEVPSEIVTASGSGLDPDISPESAYVQIKRVAMARGISESEVKKLVDSCIQTPLMGIFGTPKVNVLKLNIALSN